MISTACLIDAGAASVGRGRAPYGMFYLLPVRKYMGRGLEAAAA